MAYMDDVMRDCAERDAAYEERKAKEFHERNGPREQEKPCPNCGKTARHMCGYCSELGGWGQVDCANCGYAWNSEEGVTNPGRESQKQVVKG